MASTPKRQGGEDVAIERRSRVEKPRKFNVVVHNDNYTTMEFVVLVLMKFFHKNEAEATHIMLTVHHKGEGVAGTYTKDVAETKVQEVVAFAQTHGHPLKLSAEPDEES